MILAYFRSLAARFFHRSQTENDLEEEFRSHIPLRADDLERFGLGGADAKRRAPDRVRRRSAVRSITTNAAEMLGWQDRIGSVEAGKFADIVAVAGDPI